MKYSRLRAKIYAATTVEPETDETDDLAPKEDTGDGIRQAACKNLHCDNRRVDK